MHGGDHLAVYETTEYSPLILVVLDPQEMAMMSRAAQVVVWVVYAIAAIPGLYGFLLLFGDETRFLGVMALVPAIIIFLIGKTISYIATPQT